MQRPAPRVCSPNTSTAGSSTGTLEPTLSLCSQYANWHQQVEAMSESLEKNIGLEVDWGGIDVLWTDNKGKKCKKKKDGVFENLVCEASYEKYFLKI